MKKQKKLAKGLNKKTKEKGERIREKGITLIALVITIIVLLILAGISISMITGDNGILNQAANTSDKTDIASAKEEIQLALIGYYDENGEYTVTDVENALADAGVTLGEDGITVITNKGNTVDISDLMENANMNLTYVLDFGLPVEFTLSSLVGSCSSISAVSFSIPQYGKISYGESETTVTDTSEILTNGENLKLIYTPTTVLLSEDTITVTIQRNGVEQTGTITFIPATTVYYEETFATYGTGWSVAEGGSWEEVGTSENLTQQTSTPGNVDAYNYGYDVAYSADLDYSNGTDQITASEGDTFKFTFTGKGFEVFGNSDDATLLIMVKKDR